MKPRILFACLLILLAACSRQPEAFNYPPGVIFPTEAIPRAAYSAPKGVSGLFYVYVRTAAEDGGRIYLNTEDDYRDQRNLSVALSNDVAVELAEQYGRSAQTALLGKRLLVRGTARRVRIDVVDDAGNSSGKYYYQTHIAVNDKAQIAVQGG